jgi:hypothetical protein
VTIRLDATLSVLSLLNRGQQLIQKFSQILQPVVLAEQFEQLLSPGGFQADSLCDRKGVSIILV